MTSELAHSYLQTTASIVADAGIKALLLLAIAALAGKLVPCQ